MHETPDCTAKVAHLLSLFFLFLLNPSGRMSTVTELYLNMKSLSLFLCVHILPFISIRPAPSLLHLSLVFFLLSISLCSLFWNNMASDKLHCTTNLNIRDHRRAAEKSSNSFSTAYASKLWSRAVNEASRHATLQLGGKKKRQLMLNKKCPFKKKQVFE